MQNLVASYLFQNKSCPLPGLGTLSVINAEAVSDFSNKLISVPEPIIRFSQIETDTEGFLAYLNRTQPDASETLSQYCDGLKASLNTKQTVRLDAVGDFFLDAEGQLNFRPNPLPAAFKQSVYADRVIHPKAEHQILVGDKETTNTEMTELLIPKTVAKDNWWIWAIALAVTALLIIFVYFSELNGNGLFGNGIKI